MQKRSSHGWDGRFFCFTTKFTLTPDPSTLTGTRPFQGEGNQKEKKMNTQSESKAVSEVSEAVIKTENPMQERHCGHVTQSVEVTAEAAFTARRLEAREEAGPIFVP